MSGPATLGDRGCPFLKFTQELPVGGIGKDVGCADLRAPRAKGAGQQDQLRAWPRGFLKEVPEMVTLCTREVNRWPW